MTTPPVVSVTDELIAELEAVAHTGKGAFMIECAEVHALLAERAELKRDAGRLDWMISEQCIMRVQNGTCSPMVYSLWWSTLSEGQREWYVSPRAAIDAAMQP